METKHTEKDLKQAFYAQSFLKIVGVWPIPIGSPLSSKIRNWFITFFSLFLQICIVGPCILVMFLKEKNGKRKINLFKLLTNTLNQLFKYIITLNRANELAIAMNEIKNDWLTATSEDRWIFTANSKMGQKVMLIVAVTVYSSGLGYRMLLPILKGKIVLPNNVTIRLLPCPTYFTFFNELVSPYYEMIFMLQLLAGFFSYTVLNGTVGISLMLSLHMCSLLKILTRKMANLTDRSITSENIIQEKIVEIVEYQTKIKRFLGNAELITEYFCFYDIGCNMCLMCFIGYSAILEWENHNIAAIVVHFMLLGTCIFIIYIVCYIGQLLLDESNNLAQQCITLSWYHFPTRKARCLILMIIMSNYPVKLTAAKVVDVSLTTFTDVMKAAMGYLNMLREVI
ncbi:odorant receptor 5 [Apis mellifera]|uniref:Odorant receptor n=1 Tax=Apis mellifera TaxID=7460 RepID=A0A7M6W5Z0_APIME|nr:odorant receptor 5 [Apis mellifera]|eukprot:NP_001229888.1 odorant receptor 5 [Apis mellifera]